MAKNFNVIVRSAALTWIQPNITYEDLINNNTEKVKNINTNGENYVLILYLSELQYSTGNTTFITSIEGFLVQVNTGQVIWQDNEKNTQWLGLVGGSLDRLFGSVGSYSDPCRQYGEILTEMLRNFPRLKNKAD